MLGFKVLGLRVPGPRLRLSPGTDTDSMDSPCEEETELLLGSILRFHVS